MTRKLSVLCAAIAMLATVPAHAQSKGQLQVGVGAGLPFYSSSLGLENKVGPGVRLGFMFSNKLGIEVDAFGYHTQPSSNAYTGVYIGENSMHARLTFNTGLGAGLGFILGAGYVNNWWYGMQMNEYFGTTSSTDGGPGGLIGLRFGAGGPVSIRLDLTGDYITSPINATTNTVVGSPTADNSRFDVGMDAMLSLAFGGHKAPKDSDMDGVVDKSDLCPNTPAGDAVDANGCSLPKDSDGDGVTNDKDKCPNTPAGTKVDANGCPFGDADKDGVTDNLDKCPNTPLGATVDANGCPSDQDADGVYNGIDKCPDTPPGVKVTANGCPIDSDGDGVADYMDKCPNTPAGMQVNATGCPVLFEPGKSQMVLQGVTFATNSAVLDPTSTGILDKVANAVAVQPERAPSSRWPATPTTPAAWRTTTSFRSSAPRPS